MRLATLTVQPMTSGEALPRAPTEPTIIHPVLMPMRMFTGVP